MNGNGGDTSAPTRTEQLNQIARTGVLVMLTLGFLYGFVVSKVVSTESFAVVYGSVLAWWFAQGNRKQQADEVKDAVKAAAAAPVAMAAVAAAGAAKAEERAQKAEDKVAAAATGGAP